MSVVVGQVVLEHVDACAMEARVARRKEENFIPLDVLEREWGGDVMKMTLGAVRPSLICRCIADGIKPYKLGQQGRRKVVNHT